MTINVNSTSTIEVMRWIKENNCVELFSCVFSSNNRPFLIVSSMNSEETKGVKIQEEFDKNYWFEYDGMQRHSSKYGWVFKIQDNYYFASQY